MKLANPPFPITHNTHNLSTMPKPISHPSPISFKANTSHHNPSNKLIHGQTNLRKLHKTLQKTMTMTFSAVHWALSQSLTLKADESCRLCQKRKIMKIRVRILSVKERSSTRWIPHMTISMMMRCLKILVKRLGILISL